MFSNLASTVTLLCSTLHVNISNASAAIQITVLAL